MSEEPKEDGPVFQIYVFPKHVEMGRRGRKRIDLRLEICITRPDVAI